MDPKMVIDGLLLFIGLIVLLTFHEFGHAWTAMKCGDDTAKLQGRVSLNPIVHIDPIGTVIIPLAMIFLSMSGSGLGAFLVGWAKPVPVNPHNLRNPRRDDILVTLAGPGMNLLLAVVLIILAKVGVMAGSRGMAELTLGMAHLSLLLCFFNLIPIPPLDGSQVLRVVTGMSYETFYQFARYGFIILIIALQVPFVRAVLHGATNATFVAIVSAVGLG